MSEVSNEQVAHDLAIAVVTAQLAKKSNPSADIHWLNQYESAYREFLHLTKSYRHN